MWPFGLQIWIRWELVIIRSLPILTCSLSVMCQTICLVLLKKVATSFWSNSLGTIYCNLKYPQVYILSNTMLNLTWTHNITLSTPISWRNCGYINIDLPSIYLKGGFKNFLVGPYSWILIWDRSHNLGCDRPDYNSGSVEIL